MRYINLIADPRNNEPLFFPSDMFNKLPITSEGKIRSPFLSWLNPIASIQMEVLQMGFKGENAIQRSVIVWDVFVLFRGKHTFKETKDLKAYLPKYGAKALEEKTQFISLFWHSVVKVTAAEVSSSTFQ